MEKKYKYGILVGVIAGTIVGGFFLFDLFTAKRSLTIFHAGSLTIPFEEVEAEFEKDYPDIDIQLESAGSVQSVTKITESNQIADVLGVADYSLIPDMDDQYQDYYIKFAKNQMVIAYDGDSKYENFNETNFYTHLKKSDCNWGFSDPNLDPCGYRSLMVLQLAEIHFNVSDILDDLVIDTSDIEVSEDSGEYTITTPEDLGVKDGSNLKIREKEVDLVTLLKDGDLDYAFNYLSIAEQHDLNYITLNESMDLSDSAYDSKYEKVTVAKTSGDSTGKAINYGITIPINAEHVELATLFVEYVINKTGQDIFERLGQPPITPCPTNNLDAIPERLKEYCAQV
ncbi:MAG: tungstate ABC transporter substrate-binding protein WtpA [Promethearchaeia archaeon]